MMFGPQKQAAGTARGHARYAGAKHVCALQCLISAGGSLTWYRFCSVVLCVHCGAHYSDVMVTRLSGFIGGWRAHMSSCSPTERGLRKLLTCAVFKERHDDRQSLPLPVAWALHPAPLLHRDTPTKLAADPTARRMWLHWASSGPGGRAPNARVYLLTWRQSRLWS